jgi:hypothetical protein
MKAFTLDTDNGITLYPSIKAAGDARPDGASTFTCEEDLLQSLSGRTGNDQVEIFNSFTGVIPVKKFMDRKTAARRIWRECEKMTLSVDRETPVTIHLQELVEPEAPAAKPAKAKNAMAPAGSALKSPRDSSKTAQLIALLKTEAGMTLDAICSRFGWQPHTTRALMSAGGAIFKKYGLTVISEKVGEARTYRIA